MDPLVLAIAVLAACVAGLVLVGFMSHRDTIQAIERMDRSAAAAERAADAAREASVATREAAREAGRSADAATRAADACWAMVGEVRTMVHEVINRLPPAPAE